MAMIRKPPHAGSADKICALSTGLPMTAFESACATLRAQPRTWLVTGCAGFIGSILLEALLRLDQRVVGLDNFSTGLQHNLDEVEGLVTKEQWGRFLFIEGDITDLDTCHEVCT